MLVHTTQRICCIEDRGCLQLGVVLAYCQTFLHRGHAARARGKGGRRPVTVTGEKSLNGWKQTADRNDLGFYTPVYLCEQEVDLKPASCIN